MRLRITILNGFRDRDKAKIELDLDAENDVAHHADIGFLGTGAPAATINFEHPFITAGMRVEVLEA